MSNLLFKTIVESSNKQLFNFSELLNNRYKLSNIGEFLFEDLQTLKVLKEKTEMHILKRNIELKLRNFLIDSFLEILVKSCNQIENRVN